MGVGGRELRPLNKCMYLEKKRFKKSMTSASNVKKKNSKTENEFQIKHQNENK